MKRTIFAICLMFFAILSISQSRAWGFEDLETWANEQRQQRLKSECNSHYDRAKQYAAMAAFERDPIKQKGLAETANTYTNLASACLIKLQIGCR